MQTFSSREAEERLCAVESLLGGITARLYRKYEYLHDAYLQDMVWRFDSRGKLTVAPISFRTMFRRRAGFSSAPRASLRAAVISAASRPSPWKSIPSASARIRTVWKSSAKRIRPFGSASPPKRCGSAAGRTASEARLSALKMLSGGARP